MGHAVDRLKRKVELAEAKKEELEAAVKELRYING
jgi:hypothetical protein